MGLIDILTHYDTKKKAAHAAKTVKHGVSRSSAFLATAGYETGLSPMDDVLCVLCYRLALRSPRSTPSSMPNDSETLSPAFLPDRSVSHRAEAAAARSRY